jgi:hypothetical protein
MNETRLHDESTGIRSESPERTLSAFTPQAGSPPPPEFGVSAIPLTKQAASNGVLKDVLMFAVVGTVVGTAIGALAEMALAAANTSLFAASPLIAPLALLGWGASLGAFVGAAIGAGSRENALSTLVQRAISAGRRRAATAAVPPE